MTTPVGLRTPERNTYNMFEEENEEEEQITYNAFTPCTRLSRMTIESQSNGSSRIRSAGMFASPASNFTDKLMTAIREEESSSHPNLDMFLNTDRISMSKDKDMFSFSEDEDSDEGDLFSSNLCPMFSSSPGRVYTKSSIFDDEPMHSLFDDDNEDEEEEAEEAEVDQQVQVKEIHYDPTENWLSEIYSNNNEPVKSLCPDNKEKEEEGDEDQENRPPRFTRDLQNIYKFKSKRHDQAMLQQQRRPLGEIKFIQEDSDVEDNEDERHPKKKSLLADGKLLKMRYMRALSPPRYARRKGQEPLSTVL